MAKHENPVNEASLRKAVMAANIPTLQMTLVQLTGDLDWLEAPYQPRRPPGLSIDDSGGLPSAAQEAIQEAALLAILEHKAGREIALPTPSNELLSKMMSISVGETVPPEYADLIASMLPPSDPTSVPIEATSPPEGFNALIIGAGFSGLMAAINLQKLAIPYTILEKGSAIGGTWQENAYPGCGVDVPGHLYSLSFAPWDWENYFPSRSEILKYLNHIADEFGVRRNIAFRSEVLSASYVPDRQSWSVTIQAEDRAELEANILISAVGVFHPPVIPHIKGLDSFNGPVIHTARWPTDLELSGKNIAVIGNGASAMQVVPSIAPSVNRMTIFQRTPQWASPVEEAFAGPVPASVRTLLQEVPLYRSWLRIREAWIFNDKAYAAVQKDPSWPDATSSLNRVSSKLRQYLEQHIRTELGERTDLLDKVVPSYPPFGKRMLLDHGWFRTLTRENVELVTDPIQEITATGITTSAGTAYDVDVVILSTGFDVVRFLSSFDIYGRSGQLLREAWNDDDGAAYLGTAVPDFPNFFILYGPNTQAGHGGSLLFMVEAQMRYINSILTQMFSQRFGSIEVRNEVYADYIRRIDARHDEMVWTHPGMSTYYRNSRGRVVVNSPWRVVDFWHMTKSAELSDFVTESLAD
jgi:4-hydroxyacetophenone monooxygenase